MIRQNIIVFAGCFNAIIVTLSGLAFLNQIVGVIVYYASSIFIILKSPRMLPWGENSKEM
ncbi:hypothetical protein K2F41_16365 [Clostridium sp. CM027]|uniref:hypothetical protein n=1 Tax=Clostridium sp. CM027 TaxID=2849865 RepID=UPI001C6E4E8D|nr:hypothetical protein [Clostridium sp. CM027]MBW9147098.1 hypothetical protein [Clostridium sp. CM027]